jgi:IS30 family transposase
MDTCPDTLRMKHKGEFMIYESIEHLTARERERIKKRHRGLIRQVARELGVFHSVVSREFRGLQQSARVRAALLETLNTREEALLRKSAA